MCRQDEPPAYAGGFLSDRFRDRDRGAVSAQEKARAKAGSYLEQCLEGPRREIAQRSPDLAAAVDAAGPDQAEPRPDTPVEIGFVGRGNANLRLGVS